MTRKPFPWRKLTPAHIDLLERLAAAGSTLPYDKLRHVDLVALDELRRLKLADMGVGTKSRGKLVAVLTDKGRALRENAYRTEQVVVRVTEPQIALLRHLDDGKPYEQSVGRESHKLEGMMLDVCRRMHLRGWVERHGGPEGFRWTRLSPAGREVLAAINALDEAVKEIAAVRAHGRLH